MNEPKSNPVASIVVTCKGRLHHLRQTLPKMLRQNADFVFEVVVVDYGCPQGTFSWCRQFDVSSLIAVLVEQDTDLFSVSRARNVGARTAGGEVYAFVDADIELDEGWLQIAAAPILAGDAGLTRAKSRSGGKSDIWGTCCVSRELFHKVRGYDENMRGWGVEDNDLYERCRQQASERLFDGALLTAIPHGDDERVQYHDEKDRSASRQKNRAYRRQRRGPVNPNGYGLGPIKLFAGSHEGAILLFKHDR